MKNPQVVWVSAAIGVLGNFFLLPASTSGQERGGRAEQDAQIERGEYLVTAGDCTACHTPRIDTPEGWVGDTTRFLSGYPADLEVPEVPEGVLRPDGWSRMSTHGRAFAGPWGISFARNLTPNTATGLGSWTAEIFIKALRTGKDMGEGRDILPPMPWRELAKLTDEDLEAIFAYLRTIEPVDNPVPDPIDPSGERLPTLAPQSSYEEIEVEDGGIVRGTVRLTGDVPADLDFEVTKNAEVCGSSRPSPRLRVSQSKGVQNAVVFLEEVTRGKKIVETEQSVLNQSECEYDPHVLILPAGAQLEILNSDPILHNVHGYQMGVRRRTIFNVAQPFRGVRVRIRAKRFKAGARVMATCDAGHAWMSAYIVVAEHPYYALTDANGGFTLEDVPPGSYNLRLWHEGIAVIETDFEKGRPKKYHFEDPYEMAEEVIVPPGGSVTVDFKLALRSHATAH